MSAVTLTDTGMKIPAFAELLKIKTKQFSIAQRQNAAGRVARLPEREEGDQCDN